MASFQKDRLTLAAFPDAQPDALTRSLRDDAVQQKFSPAAVRHSSRSLRCKIPKPPKGGVDRRRPAASDGALSRPQGAAFRIERKTNHADHRIIQPGRPLRSGRHPRNPHAQDQDQVRAPQGSQREAAGLPHSRRQARSIGAAWSRTSKKGDAYLFLKLTDPSLPAPVLCHLYRNASGPAVLWTR
jgi:hypothetical protein